METPSYIAQNQEELFDNAPTVIQDLITGGEADRVTAAISATYKIPTEAQTALSNVICFILIGALQPEDVLQALKEIVGASTADALTIANDLEKGILKTAGITLFKKSEEDIKSLEYQGEKTKDELRKLLMDTTKRESGLTKNQGKPDKLGLKKTVLAPGSRNQLLEQLQVLGTIPDDEEISERLKHIQEQIAAIKKQEEDNKLTSNIALKSFMFGEKGKEPVAAVLGPATYSVAPKEYNIDPYREISGEEF